MKHPKPEILQALADAAVRAKDEQGEIAKEFNADKQVAVDEHGLHPRAFTFCVTLKRMEQVKRLAFLDAFDQYRDVLKLDDAPQVELLDEHRRKSA